MENEMFVEDRVTEQYPMVVVTLVSVITGAVLTDLMMEVRIRMHLWPLSLETIRVCAQVIMVGYLSLNVWMVSTHLAILPKRIPSLGDSVVAFLLPATLFFVTSRVGEAETWPYFYATSLNGVIGVSARLYMSRLVTAEPGTEPIKRIFRPTGYLMGFYVGIPLSVTMGWLDQHGRLSPLHATIFILIGLLNTGLATYRFFHDWHLAVAEMSAQESAVVDPPSSGSNAEI
jgi:hypothetical protein